MNSKKKTEVRLAEIDKEISEQRRRYIMARRKAAACLKASVEKMLTAADRIIELKNEASKIDAGRDRGGVPDEAIPMGEEVSMAYLRVINEREKERERRKKPNEPPTT
jgi:hypothetical protein